jgi:hypothetical protein
LFNLAIPPRIVENTGHHIPGRETTRTQGIAEAISASLAKQFQAHRGRFKVIFRVYFTVASSGE